MPPIDDERDTARENLCRFLAACYYQPGPEFAEEKVFDSMLDAAGRIHPELAAHARRLGEKFFAEGLEDLLLDYTRLFLGPSHIIAKPYGSIWLEGKQAVMGDSTVAVQALYREGGFDMDESFRELPDHVAVELEFLYLLIYRENEARRDGSPESMEKMAGIRRRFLDEHLGRWVTPFAEAVQAGAQSDFYRVLAKLTDTFVKLEAKRTAAG